MKHIIGKLPMIFYVYYECRGEFLKENNLLFSNKIGGSNTEKRHIKHIRGDIRTIFIK